MRRINVKQPWGSRCSRATFYNERIFPGSSKQSSMDNAKTALLQYNIMVNRGIVPDALTFTSLIQTMGEAKLEWQAYKLFSSMIDQGIEPMPETLVALRNATKPSRKRLIDEITDRIEETTQTAPMRLAVEVEALLKEKEGDEAVKVDQFFASPDVALTTEDPLSESTLFGDEDDRGEATGGNVAIDHPMHSWKVYTTTADGDGVSSKASGEEAKNLRNALLKLHSEELCVFATIHKLLRNGTSEELVDRILSSVPSAAISAMLHRRHRYFRAVESVTKTLLDTSSMTREGEMVDEDLGDNAHTPHDEAHSAHQSSGDMLYTPWGAIRRPSHAMGHSLRPVTSKDVPEGSWEEVVLRVTSGDTDQLPEGLLRQYAAHYSLAWSRRQPGSLSKAVEWHVENVLPSLLVGKKAPPTLAIKLRQKEASGAQESIEAYEAMRVIAKRTKNLQVTDGVDEINTSVARASAAEAYSAAKTTQATRKEEAIRNAHDLKRRATQYTNDADRLDFGKVLHEKHQELIRQSSRVLVGPSAPVVGRAPGDQGRSDTKKRSPVLAHEKIRNELQNESSELPPWELGSASQPFNVDTGRFGDPTMGRYMELNDGKVRLMPQHESLSSHHSQAGLLPRRDREGILRHKAHSIELQRKEDEELKMKSQSPLYQRRERHLDKFRLERAALREKKAQSPAPVSRPKRMRQFLKVGKDKERLSLERFQRFTRPE